MKIYTNILTVLAKYQSEKRKKRLSLFYVLLYTLVLTGCAANTKNFTDSISSTRAEAMCNKNIEISETIKRISELSTKISHVETAIGQGNDVISKECEEVSGSYKECRDGYCIVSSSTDTGSRICIEVNGACIMSVVSASGKGSSGSSSSSKFLSICPNEYCTYFSLTSVNGHHRICTKKSINKDKLPNLKEEKARENDKYLAYAAQCKNYVLGLPAGISDDSPQLLNMRWRTPPK